jgi:hypothetical protein
MNPKHMAFEIFVFGEITVLDSNLRLTVAVSEATSLAASRTLSNSSNPSNSGRQKPFGKVIFCSYVVSWGMQYAQLEIIAHNWSISTADTTPAQTVNALS